MALDRKWTALIGLGRRLHLLAGDRSVFAQLGAAGREVRVAEREPESDALWMAWEQEHVEAQYAELAAVTFMAAQREIMFYVSAVHWMNSRLSEPLPWSVSKVRLVGMCPAIELLDAAANYVKHADEWQQNWEHASDKRHLRTIGALANAGVVGADRMFPIPVLCRKLGMDSDLGRAAEHIRSWGQGLVAQVATELERRREIKAGWETAVTLSLAVRPEHRVHAGGL